MGELILRGRVWKFGDDVSVGSFLAPKYDTIGTKPEESSKHVLEESDPTFIQRVKKGDVIVAGKRFGSGKHHYFILAAMKYLGVAGYIAESFDPIFHHEAIDRGYAALPMKELSSKLNTGDEIELNPRTGEARILNRNITIKAEPVSEVLLSIVEAGGLEPYTLRRMGVTATTGSA